jgi:hypothetical protein
MPRQLLLLIFTFLSASLYAQHYTIAGYVISPANTPVNDALVTIGTSSTGTNSKGYFTIKTDILPDVLTASHREFADKEVFINLPPLGNDTIFVQVRMEDKHTELEEVRITASRAIWAYPVKNVHIIDFDLYHDGMLLLCYDYHQYLLRWVDAQNQPVFDLPVHERPRNFFRDCDDNIHLVYRDSIFEVAFRNDSLSLEEGITVSEAQKTIQHCGASLADKQIWRYWGPYNQSVEFFLKDTITDKQTHIYSAKDRRYMRGIREYQYDVAHGGRSMRDRDQNDYTDIQERIQLASEKQRIYEQSVVRPAYVPVFKLRDSLVLFDHLNDTATVYDANGKVRTFPIIYQHHKKWDHELIVNEEGTRIFARFDHKGMAHLVEVNPDTGELMKETVLEEHIYPTKIQIKGDFVYYIYHFYIDNSINYVYKQHLALE